MDAPGSGEDAGHRLSSAVKWPVIAAAGVLAVGAIAVWIAPAPLAAMLAGAWLRAHGVDSRITIMAITGAGLTAMARLGDQGDPALTIDRIVVTYRLDGPWNGRGLGLAPTSVRLVRPRLRLTLIAGRADFGRLDPLARWALRQPPSREPMPKVAIDDGELRLAADGAVLTFRGSGAFDGEGLIAMRGTLAPFHRRLVDRRLGALTIEGDGGTFEAARRGGRLNASLALGAVRLQMARGSVGAARLMLAADLPDPGPGMALAGPARLDADVKGLVGRFETSQVGGGAAHAALAGVIDASADRQSFSGALRASAQAAGGDALGAAMDAAALEADLDGLVLTRDTRGLSVEARGGARLSLGRLATADARASDLAAAVTLSQARLTLGPGAPAGVISLVGRVSGRGALTAAAGRRLAALARSLAPAIGGAAVRNFRFSAADWRLDADSGGARLALLAPARLETRSGARLTLGGAASATVSPGARGPGSWRARGTTAVSLAGGSLPALNLTAANWTASPAGLQADVAGTARVDTESLRGAGARIAGRFGWTAGRARFDLTDCADLSARRIAAGTFVADQVSARLCARDGPLFEARGGRWRALGRFESVAGSSADMSLRLRQAGLSFAADGAAAGADRIEVAIDQATVIDLADPVRFWPVTLTGALHGIRNAWTGELTAAGRGGVRLARLALVQDALVGAGRLDIDTGALMFAAGGMQPSDVTPLARFARRAEGRAAFKGWLAWGGAGAVASGGELVAQDLGFTGPLGPVTGIDADVRLARLFPVETAPAQRLTVRAIQTPTPVTGLALVFDVDPTGARIRSAKADFAGGQVSLDPFTVPFAPGGGYSSVLTLRNVDLGAVLAASNLADRVQMRAIVGGAVPFSVGPKGVTISHGALATVGGGRLSISRTAFQSAGGRVGGSAAAAAQTGFAQDLAYQAMENLAFDSLDASLTSLAGDRLGVIFHVKGRHSPPERQRASLKVFDLLRGKALDRPMALPSDTRIDLTLDTTLNFGDLVAALEAAWDDALKPAHDPHQDVGGPIATTPIPAANRPEGKPP